jgi:hypothetical protein
VFPTAGGFGDGEVAGSTVKSVDMETTFAGERAEESDTVII